MILLDLMTLPELSIPLVNWSQEQDYIGHTFRGRAAVKKNNGKSDCPLNCQTTKNSVSNLMRNCFYLYIYIFLQMRISLNVLKGHFVRFSSLFGYKFVPNILLSRYIHLTLCLCLLQIWAGYWSLHRLGWRSPVYTGWCVPVQCLSKSL